MKVDDIESEHLRMLVKCLKTGTKGECYDMLAEETKDWKECDIDGTIIMALRKIINLRKSHS